MNRSVAGVMLGVTLLAGGCAATPGDPAQQQVAQTEAEQSKNCQTDYDTGTRLSKHTVCDEQDSLGAQQATRGIQRSGYISPAGH
jgi:hypothetical protein